MKPGAATQRTSRIIGPDNLADFMCFLKMFATHDMYWQASDHFARAIVHGDWARIVHVRIPARDGLTDLDQLEEAMPQKDLCNNFTSCNCA